MNPRFDSLLPILKTTTPPELGPRRRPSTLSLEATQQLISERLQVAGLANAPEAGLIRSLGLLWHDHLDASHGISQGIHSVDGSYIHGIMHRREPDYGNAAYWFARVGEHPIHAALAAAAGGLTGPESVKTQVIPGGRWSARGMVDACEAAATGTGSPGGASFLRAAQRLEFELLLRHFAGLQPLP